MQKNPINSTCLGLSPNQDCPSRRTPGWLRLAARPAAALALALAVLSQPARADVVVLDDHFDDGDLATNTTGTGTGFTVYQEAGGTAIEGGSVVRLESPAAGWNRSAIASKNGIAISAGGTKYEFRGTSFTNSASSFGGGDTDRLYFGVGNTGTAGDWQGSPPPGFWIEIETDSVATGSGNGSWNGNSTLFFKDMTGTKTALATWTFDTLNWDGTGPNNFAPLLDITLTLSANSWALNITGDTSGSSPISFNNTYAGSGINLVGFGAATHVAAFCQDENPAVILSLDRVVTTQLGNVIVPFPVLATPDYPYNTNRVLAGESVVVTCAVVSSGSPTYQWQLEDISIPGTFTNIPGATTTNLVLNTSGLGDSQARGIRLVVTDGGSINSAAVALTVDPASAPVLAQDTTPAGPEVRNIGLGITYTAAFSGSRPMSLNWQKSPNNITWTNILNATNASLNLVNLGAGDAGYYRLFATNSLGSNNTTGSQLIVSNANPKFVWSALVPFGGLTADQILTNFPGTKVAGAMMARGGTPVAVTLGSGSPIVFGPPNNWATLTGGNGTFGGANTNQTGNANFNTALSDFYFDGATHTITFSGLVVGQQYSVQLFALDNRTIDPPASARTVNWQDPADATDVSATYSMADNAYLVGTFTASNTTESVQQNLLTGSGNFNCLVLRAIGFNPPPYFAVQPPNGGGYLGGSAVISGATAAGDSTIASPAITYQWASGPAGGPYTNLVEGAKYNGTTSANLAINNCVAADALVVYVLTASNGGGSTASREVSIALQPAVTPALLGHWLSGSPNYADTSGYTPAGTHDGFLSGSGTVYHFTNDVPPGATGTNALYLGGNIALAVANTSIGADSGYLNTFDETISNRFTVTFWAKGYPGGFFTPAFVGKRGESDIGWQIRRIGGGRPGFTLRGTPGADDPEGSIAVDATSWHHYAATWDGLTGVRRMYVDGNLSLELFGDTGPMALAPNYRLTIGARESGSVGTEEAFFTGTLYDVRIYNYALNRSEVGAIGSLPPPLTFQNSGSNQLTLSWPWGTLLEATNIVGPWTTNAATSPYTPDMTAPQKYFRVKNP